jgi:hypothetical protein
MLNLLLLTSLASAAELHAETGMQRSLSQPEFSRGASIAWRGEELRLGLDASSADDGSWWAHARAGRTLLGGERLHLAVDGWAGAAGQPERSGPLLGVELELGASLGPAFARLRHAEGWASASWLRQDSLRLGLRLAETVELFGQAQRQDWGLEVPGWSVGGGLGLRF